MSKNDDKIIVLKNKIESMKTDLKENKPVFKPITNCMLSFHGNDYNLHAMTPYELKYLLVIIGAEVLACEDLKTGDYYGKVLEDYTLMYGNFTAVEWMQDIREKIEVLNYRNKELGLKTAEKQLEKLLSEDKKVELQIDEIVKQFGLE